jgi:hypothetical protein
MAIVPIDIPTMPPVLMIAPWDDPVVDRVGYDVRSTYVELFWLNVLGPTATWLLRRLVSGFDRHPLGYELDMQSTAGALGLSYTIGTANAFARSVQRCTLFGAAQPIEGGLAVRRRLPPVGRRHLARMPGDLQQLHAGWTVAPAAPDTEPRARVLAEAMRAVGDSPDAIERQLLALGVSPNTALDVVEQLFSPTPAPQGAA